MRKGAKMSSITAKMRTSIVAISLTAMVGCTNMDRNHGYAPSEDELLDVIVGVDTRDTVLDLFGKPTSTGVVEGGGYYYVASRFRHFGPFEPKPIDRQLVAISFDTAGVVTNIERFTLADGKVVPLSRRVTDTNIQDTTFLRQLLGNIGNFDAGQFVGES